MKPDLKILIVDDFDIVRTMIKTALTNLNFTRLEQAKNGKQALEMLKQSEANGDPFQLVFLDWNMPVMNGYELLTHCRAHANFKLLKFIMVTVESEQKTVIDALKAGADDYIVKPFSSQKIQEKIVRIFRHENFTAAQ